MEKILNVLGTELQTCGNDPVTGWFRDGCCNTDIEDHGIHTICTIVTRPFLEFLKKSGNDLITPNPEFGFQGLKDGDSWCVCAGSWFQAYNEGVACPVKLECTHEETLAIIPLKALKEFAVNQ